MFRGLKDNITKIPSALLVADKHDYLTGQLISWLKQLRNISTAESQINGRYNTLLTPLFLLTTGSLKLREMYKERGVSADLSLSGKSNNDTQYHKSSRCNWGKVHGSSSRGGLSGDLFVKQDCDEQKSVMYLYQCLVDTVHKTINNIYGLIEVFLLFIIKWL